MRNGTVTGVIGFALLVACTSAPAGEESPVTTDDSPARVSTSTTTTTGGTEPVASSPREKPLPDAPWSAEVLSQDDVPSVLVEQWNKAENRLWCSALAPTAAIPEDAEPRAANFGGGWAVAWDRQGERSAFGVAGAGIVVDAENVRGWPNLLEWSDGSLAGFGGEGRDPSNPNKLAYMMIDGQACNYNIWSHLGLDHLVQLIKSLRFVEELQAEPLEPDEIGGVRVVTQAGPAPWQGPPIPTEDVPDLILEEWSKTKPKPSTPLVYFSGAGDLAGARIRTANVGRWGVAWDNASGPGHDGQNRPCADCGRGVVGLGADYGTPDLGFRKFADRVEWDDGSYAEYGLRLGPRELPRDRVIFNDPATGEPVEGALEARLVIHRVDAEYIIWTHLGEEHLLELLESLRFVEVAP